MGRAPSDLAADRGSTPRFGNGRVARATPEEWCAGASLACQDGITSLLDAFLVKVIVVRAAQSLRSTNPISTSDINLPLRRKSTGGGALFAPVWRQ